MRQYSDDFRSPKCWTNAANRPFPNVMARKPPGLPGFWLVQVTPSDEVTKTPGANSPPAATYVPFPYAMPTNSSVVVEFWTDQVLPLAEVRIVPESPTATKRLFAKVIAYKEFDTPEFCLLHELPSAERRIVTDSPTATNTPLP